MWLSLVKSLVFGGLDKALAHRRDVKIAKMQHNNEINTVVKELELTRLENEKSAHETAMTVRMATKDHWEMRFAISIVALTTSLHYGFTVIEYIYNTGWNIQPLPKPLDEWQATIILSYFGYGTARTITNVVAAKLLKR